MQILWRFLGFARPYRGPLSASIILVLITSALGMPMTHFAGKLITKLGELFGRGWETLTPEAQSEATNNVFHFLYIFVVAFAGLHIINAIIGYSRSLIMMFLGNRVIFDVRQRLFRHIQRLSMRYFERHGTGHIMARVLYDVDAVQYIVTGGIVDTLTNIVNLMFAMGFIIWYSVKVESFILPLIAIGVLPLYIINFLAMQKKIRNAAAEQRDQFSNVYSTLAETISGIRVIKSFAREQYEARRFVREIRESIDLNIRVGKLRTILGINAGLLTQMADLAILFIGGTMVVHHRMELGELVAFRGYLGMMYGPILALVTINDTINWVMAAIERIFETLDTMPDVQEAEEPKRLNEVQGHVEFKHVDFYYDPGEMVLEDINIDAKPGTVTALVGPSGSGKTTLAALIPRFYDTAGGEIIIDGIRIKDILIRSLRRNIGMVLQENFLFQGTLRENIKYGRPEATDEEVIQASIAANCHDFIMEFPDGYETTVGERGTRLSGGQRQRMSIARALLSNPRILILDEATSDLDSESEALIQDALEKLMKNRTTFIIAHRLSTVMNADEIIVLDHGHVVERGTHAELATADGLYARLCEVQFKRAQEKVDEHLAKIESDLADEAAMEEIEASENDTVISDDNSQPEAVDEVTDDTVIDDEKSEDTKAPETDDGDVL